jgi:single-strand DNA-binding protein
MSFVNKVTLMGNLGQDPDLKSTNSGNAVATMSVATNESWTDKAGVKQERTEWHRVQVWGKTAENCAKYLKKGSKIYAEGKLQTRSWDDKDGVKRYTTEIVAQTVQFLGAPTGGGARPPHPADGEAPTTGAPPETGGSFTEDEIPF